MGCPKSIANAPGSRLLGQPVAWLVAILALGAIMPQAAAFNCIPPRPFSTAFPVGSPTLTNLPSVLSVGRFNATVWRYACSDGALQPLLTISPISGSTSVSSMSYSVTNGSGSGAGAILWGERLGNVWSVDLDTVSSAPKTYLLDSSSNAFNPVAAFVLRYLEQSPNPTLNVPAAGTVPNTAQLTLSKIGNGGGIVTSSPTGINCGSTCQANFTHGTVVAFEAVPSAGSSFGGWSACDSVAGSSCSITVSGNRSVGAIFTSRNALRNGIPATGLEGSAGVTLAYTIWLPQGVTNLVVRTYGGVGNPDLYVRWGTAPTTTSYDCRSAQSGPSEVCTIPVPVAGSNFPYYVVVRGDSAFSGLTLAAQWGGATGPLDEPSLAQYALPVPDPQNANCPAGFFSAVVGDGPGGGLTAGAFGMEVLLDEPGTRTLAGGLNFGGLVDAGQVGFAGFTIANPANEVQRLGLNLTGSPASSNSASFPVRVRISRRTVSSSELVFEATPTISLVAPYVTSVDLPPAFYEVTVAPLGGTAGGAPEGQFFFSMTTSFINRPGGGFQGGAVVGGYHATHPFGGVSGFAAFCLATPHSTSIRVLSQPSYGATGARDLRLRLQDAQQQSIVVVPAG